MAARIMMITGLLALSACLSPDAHSANQLCTRTAGCVSSFANPGYGPIQAQAVAPANPGPLQPQP